MTATTSSRCSATFRPASGRAWGTPVSSANSSESLLLTTLSQQWGARAGLFLGGALSLIAVAAAAWGLRRERLRADGAHEVVALPPTFDVELEDATA